MLGCIKDKGTEFLFQGLLGLPGDKSTWAVMLFRKKGAAGETVAPSSCLSCTIPYTPLPHLPAPQPHKTFLAGTFNLWVQSSAPVLLAGPHVHIVLSVQALRLPTGDLGRRQGKPQPLPAHLTASGSNHWCYPFSGAPQILPHSTEGAQASGPSQLWQVTTPDVCRGQPSGRSLRGSVLWAAQVDETFSWGSARASAPGGWRTDGPVGFWGWGVRGTQANQHSLHPTLRRELPHPRRSEKAPEFFKETATCQSMTPETRGG